MRRGGRGGEGMTVARAAVRRPGVAFKGGRARLGNRGPGTGRGRGPGTAACSACPASLLPHPGIVGVDQERGPEKVEEGEEEDPVWLLSENSNPVGGKLVSLSGGEGERRVQGLQKNTFDPK